MPISGSTVSGLTVSSGLSTTAPSTPTGDANWDVAQFNSGTQTSAQIPASLENAAPPTNYRTSVADFVLREFQAAWGVVPTAGTTTSQYDTWVARIIANPSLENGGMSQALAGTPEFLTPYGLTSATEPASLAFVTQLCSNLFGVAPGPGALLNVGLPVWQVLQNFAQSSEFIAGTSAAIVGFQSALLHGPTPTGSIFQFGGTTATYALTTGNDTNASLGPSPFTASDLIAGIIAQTGVGPLLNASTLNPGDALALGGATLSITDLNHLAGNELAGVSLTGPFKFVVNEIAPTAGTFDFLTASGATNVELLNSSQNVSFTNLAAGTNVEIGGAGTVSGTMVQTSYASSPTAVSYQIDGGVNGVTFEPGATSTNAPTSETILSTGAANGTTAHWDTFHATNSLGSVTQLTDQCDHRSRGGGMEC